MTSQNSVWLWWPPPWLRTAVLIASGTELIPRSSSSTLLLLQVRGRLERLVEVGDVGGVVLVVMDLHRLGVDVRLESVEGVTERWNLVRHRTYPPFPCTFDSARGDVRELGRVAGSARGGSRDVRGDAASTRTPILVLCHAHDRPSAEGMP